jgi:predicted nucleic acid-binding protein
VIYLDSSALVKLVVREPESDALFRFLESHRERVSSAIARVEVVRAVRRLPRSGMAIERATQVLDRIALVPVDDAVLANAAMLDPSTLRSLDAIHLGTALTLPMLDAFVAYDAPMLAAAVQLGCEPVSPR